MTTDTSGNSHIRNVDVPELIGAQRSTLGNALTEVVNKLKKEEMDHREKYRGEKLVEIFPETLGYTYEKIADTIHGRLPPRVGETLVTSIIEAITAFKSALDSRGILQAYESSIGHVLTELEYALNELRDYFNVSESKLNNKDASIFLFFARRKMEELITIAKELDEQYATGFPT